MSLWAPACSEPGACICVSLLSEIQTSFHTVQCGCPLVRKGRAQRLTVMILHFHAVPRSS